MPLDTDQPRRRTMEDSVNGDHFQNFIVEILRPKHLISRGAAPEVRPALIAGNVQHDDALQRRQLDPMAVAFQMHSLFEISIRPR